MDEQIGLRRVLDDEAATRAWGSRLAAALPGSGAIAIALSGALGAGKSTLARALLRRLGVAGPIPSPTYTLIEPYATARGPAYHMDFYRLGSPQEAGFLGVDEIVNEEALCLVEWPERGDAPGMVFDMGVALQHAGAHRLLALRALTERGRAIVTNLRGDT